MMAKPGRLHSLDAFRGLTIAGMLLVNNPGSWNYVYQPLRHAEWHGWTPTDLIFPFFLFIVGVAMAFSIVRRQEEGTERSALFKKVLIRSAIIVVLGLLLSGFPRYDIGEMRFPGVLQRIGLAYLIASTIVLYTGVRGQAYAIGALLLAYWGLMELVPVPGYGAGDLSPNGNLAAYIDRQVFGSHLWQETWDPEGLLSTIPAVATVLTGTLVGHLLRSARAPADITGSLFTWGWVAIIAGLTWGIWFPINKNLWTSSYVLFTSGAAMQALGVCYWLIEIKKIRRWSVPAQIMGVNAIAAFVLSGLVARLLTLVRVPGEPTTSVQAWLYDNVFAPLAGPMNGSLLFAMTTVVFWLGILMLMQRRGIVIKI